MTMAQPEAMANRAPIANPIGRGKIEDDLYQTFVPAEEHSHRRPAAPVPA